MKSYRTRLTVGFACASIGLLLLVAVGVVGIIYATLYHDERSELLELAARVGDELAQEPGGDTPEAEFRDAAADLNSKLSFLFDDSERNYGYAIIGPDGSWRYEFHASAAENPFHSREWIQAQHDDFFAHFSAYNQCTFYRRLAVTPFTILVSSTHHLEVLDKLAYTLLLLPLAVVIAFALGHWLSSRIIVPINTITRAAQDLEAGDLTRRITHVEGGDEMTRLITVLNGTFDRLEKSFAEIQQFSADVSHELRTPLTALRGHMEVCLRRERTPDEYRATLTQSVDEIRRLDGLVERLLLLSRHDETFRRESFEDVDLAVVIADVKELLQGLAEEKQMSFTSDGDAGVWVRGDASLLTQLIHNLVHNAIKFTPPGGAVTVRSRRDADAAVVSVRDTGIGIAAADRERIFDRLYQAAASRGDGHGLGLAIVRWTADLHDGTVRVSESGADGSCFEVRMPATRAAEKS